MNYIILDLEWNQPFCVQKMVKEPNVIHGEIIQIGAVKLDDNYHFVDTFKIMVAPKYYRTMHKKICKLTNITTEDLQYGFPFKVAFKHFSNWCGEDFAFLTWGPDDIEMLRENMNVHNVSTKWIPSTYNLQIIFDNQLTKTNHQISLKHAMEHVGEPALAAHDALNDARNTARLCSHIDISKGLVEYSALAKEFNKQTTKAVDKCRNGKAYKFREEALNDSSLLTFYCPNCGAQTMCVDFVKQNADKYICIGKCENGEEYFVRFKFAKNANGTFNVVRIIYEMDEENTKYYYLKKLGKQSNKQIHQEPTTKVV